MGDAVYVRFDEEDLTFVENLSKEENVTRSETIKKLVRYATSHLKIDRAIRFYREGKGTIRECAEMAGMRYFEFFDALAHEGLIGTNPENTELILHQLTRNRKRNSY